MSSLWVHQPNGSAVRSRLESLDRRCQAVKMELEQGLKLVGRRSVGPLSAGFLLARRGCVVDSRAFGERLLRSLRSLAASASYFLTTD
jgi:hypothetical protein